MATLPRRVSLIDQLESDSAAAAIVC